MADILSKLNKALLLEVAEEFDTSLHPKCTIKDIRNAILEASDFEVELLKILIERIMFEAEESKKIAEQQKLSEARLDKLAEQEHLDKLAEQEWLDKIVKHERESESE